MLFVLQINYTKGKLWSRLMEVIILLYLAAVGLLLEYWVQVWALQYN